MNGDNSINISDSNIKGDILQGNIVEGGIKNTHTSELLKANLEENIVFLNVKSGDFQQGFDVTLRINSDTEINGRFPSAPNIPKLYQDWHSQYLLMNDLRGKDIEIVEAINNTEIEKLSPQESTKSTRLKKPLAINNAQLKKQCQSQAQELRNSIRIWLSSQDIELQKIREKLLKRLPNQQEEIRVIIQTEVLLLKQLPWQEWDLFSDFYTKSEIALSSPDYDPVSRVVAVKHHHQVRILGILGDSHEIEIERNRQLIESLPNAYSSFLKNPKRKELTDNLWDKDWDILFFTGHSSQWGKGGNISINENENLTIEDFKRGLKRAIERGLRIAIFNSCDGLGLAKELEDLHIPQIIIMREPLPFKFANEFLQYFLKAFADGKSLYLAVREAKERLYDEGLETEIPGATWLPVICQNPGERVATWQELALGNFQNPPTKNVKEKIMNNQDVITYLESPNGLDFISPNYQKSSENYGRIFNIVYGKLKLINMQTLLTKLQQEPTDVNKLVFMEILKAQILADQEFAQKLIDIITQLKSDEKISSDHPSVEKIEQKINYGNARFYGNFTGGNQNVTK